MRDELQEKILWQNINSSKEKGKILIGKSRFKIDMSQVNWKINIEREHKKWYCLSDEK